MRSNVSCFNPFRTRLFQPLVSSVQYFQGAFPNLLFQKFFFPWSTKLRAWRWKVLHFLQKSCDELEMHAFKAESQAERVLDPQIRLHTFLPNCQYPPCSWLPNTALSIHQNESNHNIQQAIVICLQKQHKHQRHREKEQTKFLDWIIPKWKDAVDCTYLGQQEVIWLEVRTHKKRTLIF